jgi:hypothetical protein
MAWRWPAVLGLLELRLLELWLLELRLLELLLAPPLLLLARAAPQPPQPAAGRLVVGALQGRCRWRLQSPAQLLASARC